MVGFDEHMSHPARAHIRSGESRWPAAIATLVAIGLYALLPNDLLFGPRYVIPGLELVLVAIVVAENPLRMSRQTRFGRIASLAVLYLILLSNFVALVLLLHRLVSTGEDQGPTLLLAALQVWLTNVIVFALAFWQLDRGGPIARHSTDRRDLQAADFRFPQDEDHDTIDEVRKGSSAVSGWMAVYVDYLYVSLTNSSAFSPTDTMPLTSRAKLLMGTQSAMALITSVVVIAKGVGSLK